MAKSDIIRMVFGTTSTVYRTGVLLRVSLVSKPAIGGGKLIFDDRLRRLERVCYVSLLEWYSKGRRGVRLNNFSRWHHGYDGNKGSVEKKCGCTLAAREKGLNGRTRAKGSERYTLLAIHEAINVIVQANRTSCGT